MPQAREFNYLGVLFMAHRKVEREMNRWFGEPDPRGEEGAEPKDKAFLLPVDLEYVPALTHDHELWVVAERTSSQNEFAPWGGCAQP